MLNEVHSIFGIMTAVFEFRLPPVITQFASFMFSFLGRGICKYLLLYDNSAMYSWFSLSLF